MHSESSLSSLLLAGAGSNAGKTVTAAALICALQARGLVVQPAKTGPDYIDAAWHAALCGMPSVNLDAWMAAGGPPDAPPPSPRALRERLARIRGRLAEARGKNALLLVEGAMGLFDGAAGPDGGGLGSSAHLAVLCRMPVALLINTRGMGQSAAALAEGYLRFRPPWAGRGKPIFAGFVCTHVGSERHAALLRAAFAPLERRYGIPLLGCLPRAGAPDIASRHLGLVQAQEAAGSLDRVALARWLETHLRVDELLERLGLPARATASASLPLPSSPPPNDDKAASASRRRRLVVAIARDEAFSFLYADLPPLLRRLGADVRFFSPLRERLPQCCGVYLPGGYPELHAAALTANVALREDLRRAAKDGLPVHGECGGYLYLMRSLRLTDGGVASFCGLLPLDARLGTRRAALGYRAVRLLPGWLPGADERPVWLRGHEFHYAETATPPSGATALWQSYASDGLELGPEGCRQGNVSGSWVHLYPQAALAFWRGWLRLLRRRT